MNNCVRDQYRIKFLVSVVGWAFFPLPPAPPLISGGSQWEKKPGLVTQISSASVLEVSYYLLIFK